MGPGALDTALALYHSPSLAAATRLRPLPGDVFEVIRIAAGDADATATAVERSGSCEAEVREASQLYLEHVLFDPDADHYRVLGVPVDAEPERLREHRRWLLKWLHPDRADDWDAVYAARVQQAWQELRDPGRRARYDQSLVEAGDRGRSVPGAALRPVWTARELQLEERGGRLKRTGWLLAAAPLVIVGGVTWLAWPSAAPTDQEAPGVVSSPEPATGGVARVLEPVPIPEEAQVVEPTPRATPTLVAATPAADAPAAGPAAPRTASTPASTDSDPVSVSGAAAAVSVPMASPAPAEAPVPRVTGQPTIQPARQGIDTAAIEAAMNTFRAAYERGDIEALMDVFTHDARTRRGGRDAIRQDYVDLFDASRQRSLQWHSLQWETGRDHAVGEGGFVARITPRRGATNIVRGRLRVEVVQRGGRVGIIELWHEDQAP